MVTVFAFIRSATRHWPLTVLMAAAAAAVLANAEASVVVTSLLDVTLPDGFARTFCSDEQKDKVLCLFAPNVSLQEWSLWERVSLCAFFENHG